MTGYAKALCASAVAMLMLPIAAGAAEFRYPGTDSDGNVVIQAGETIHDDLYVAGGKVTIMGTVEGNVFMVGGDLQLSGAVTGDVNAAGGDIGIDGPVGGSVRVVGGQAKLGPATAVGGDLVFVGGTLDLPSGTSIGRDLIMAGGQLTDAGSVSRNLLVRGGDVVISGPVTGWADIGSDSLALASNANVGGDLTFRSPSEPTVAEGATVGGELKKIAVERQKAKPGLNAMRGFWKAVTHFLLALFLVLVFDKKSAAVVHDFRGRVGRNALYGLAAFFMTIPAALLLLVTLIGAPFAFFLIFLWVIALYVAGAYLAIWVGQLLRKTFMKDKPLGWYDAAIGTLVLWVVAMVPVIGWVVELAFLIYALGVLVAVEIEVMKLVRKTDIVPHA